MEWTATLQPVSLLIWEAPAQWSQWAWVRTSREIPRGSRPRALMAGYIDVSGDSTLPASTRVRLSPMMRTELTK